MQAPPHFSCTILGMCQTSGKSRARHMPSNLRTQWECRTWDQAEETACKELKNLRMQTHWIDIATKCHCEMISSMLFVNMNKLWINTGQMIIDRLRISVNVASRPSMPSFWALSYFWITVYTMECLSFKTELECVLLSSTSFKTFPICILLPKHSHKHVPQ